MDMVIPKHTHINELKERIKDDQLEIRMLRREIKRRGPS